MHGFGQLLALQAIIALAAGFISITFLQSGLDKLFDYKGNLAFMKEQFAKTFLNKMIVICLPVIMIGELIAGLYCVWGVIQLFRQKGSGAILYAFFLSGIILLMLLFGQRVSKQYAGAVSLTGYFIIVLIGMMMVVLLRNP
ncbi:MAG: DoxX family protein [Bacteroidia bacterium]